MDQAQYTFNVFILHRSAPESAAGQIHLSSAALYGSVTELQAVPAVRSEVSVDPDLQMVIFRGFMVAREEFLGLRVELVSSWIGEAPEGVQVVQV
ncbi:hypothetical protein DC3_09350 [Deinococcus cellulosilyticus NBRC 106333 = KACC 11606]|uniref:Uncharacterized protein n=1 Tax=Deinococcus cellulosilyticus (strain DSM 18568 / NBRC 106333 / KACC 11606 / 5516J-15) TaxID=1223518 RepID=A0A511MXL1_DEIC1|nr:hypothetical protein DC3_09350 [Deinococcus cellulosilyticus NBRC 106333 = KACC 11606]